MPFAVVVTFQIEPACYMEFMPLMLSNARASLTQEKGCLQFDVATDPARPNEVFLYEIYTDRAAFDLHLASAHFRSFDRGAADMILSKSVKTFESVVQ